MKQSVDYSQKFSFLPAQRNVTCSEVLSALSNRTHPCPSYEQLEQAVVAMANLGQQIQDIFGEIFSRSRGYDENVPAEYLGGHHGCLVRLMDHWGAANLTTGRHILADCVEQRSEGAAIPAPTSECHAVLQYLYYGVGTKPTYDQLVETFMAYENAAMRSRALLYKISERGKQHGDKLTVGYLMSRVRENLAYWATANFASGRELLAMRRARYDSASQVS